MMRKKDELKKIGERELDVMRVLWRRGTSSVYEVQAALHEQGDSIAYTTVQTMLNRLEAKGFVARDNSGRSHRYRPLIKELSAAGGALRGLIDRFFGGSAEALATHLVEHNLSSEQLGRVQSLIDESHKRGRKE
jgi:predicted transcriptional regulator